MNDFISCECSDARVGIYGLLGVLNERQMVDFPIVPDNSKSVQRLFLEVWTMWLRSILNGETSRCEATLWLEVRRYATRLQRRLRLFGTAGDDNPSRLVLEAIDTREKQVTEMTFHGPSISSGSSNLLKSECKSYNLLYNIISSCSHAHLHKRIYTKSKTSPLSPTMRPTLLVPTILSNSILSQRLKHTLTPPSARLISARSTVLAMKPTTSS
jgi:hypothetical protein